MATAIHQYEDKLLDFAYGELPAPEASAVESHLKSCVRCTQALDQIRGVRATMSALPQEPAPIAGLESLLAYAEQAAARHAAAPKPGLPWWRRMVGPVAGLCALALVVVVAIETQEQGLDLSASKAASDAAREKSANAAARAPEPVVAAAPPPPAEPVPQEEEKLLQNAAVDVPKVAQKMKAGKTVELDRKAKENRNWDGSKQQQYGLAKNDKAYSQELGETQGPAEDRQAAQRTDLGDSLAVAAKESKSRREADYGNARGGYVQGKEAEQAPAAAPMGLSTASTKPAPPPSPQPTAKPPEKAEKPSIALGMGSSGSTRRSGARDNADDDLAGRGANEIADNKRVSKDVEADQRDLEQEARAYLSAARAAGNSSNHQEEIKQSLAALATGVKGASRAEALNRLCGALDELGNEGQADQYCNALIREFPKTSYARAVLDRRNGTSSQRAQKKSPAPARAYDEAAEKKAEQPKPAETAPASAY